jgi:CHASE3 domain sensor protein
MADADAAIPRRTPVRDVGVARTLAILLILALATALFILGVGNQVRSEEDSVTGLQALRAEVSTAQSSVRGFTLVGRPRFLEPYRQAVPAFGETLDDLNAAMEGHELRRLARMAAIFAEWRRRFAEPTIALVRQGRTEDALALARTGSGKRRIDLLKALIADEIHEEQREIDKAEQLEWVLGAVAIIVIAGLCLALAFSEWRRRRRAG